MKKTKLISAVAVLAILSGSSLYGDDFFNKVRYGDYEDLGGQNKTKGNIWVGQDAFTKRTDGKHNSVLGIGAGQNTTVGNDNTFMGSEAGKKNITGSGNTYIGSLAGADNMYGSGNVFLGYAAGQYENGDNKLYIDNNNTDYPLIYGDFDADALQVNGMMDINASGKDVGGVTVYPTLTLNAADIPTDEMSWGIYLGQDADDSRGLMIANNAAQKVPVIIGNDANDSLLGLFKNSVAVNFDGVGEIDDDAANLIVGGDILATLTVEDDANMHNIIALDVNNTGGGSSNVGFSLEDKESGYKWSFRTYKPSEGFAASKIGTGGTEFEVGNTGTDLNTTVVKMGGVVVFENGAIVNDALASLVQEQNIKLAAMEAKDTTMEAAFMAKDAEIIAMKAEVKTMKIAAEAQNIEIAQLKTMQQKVAMMESILTNLALNTSDTDKTKVSVNLK